MDTRWWNLTLGVVAAVGAGCGPTVVLYGDTEADTSDDTGPLPDTGIDPPTADGPQCSDAVPCPDNQVCVDGVCMDGYADDNVDYSDYSDYKDYSDYADDIYCYEYGPKGECCDYYECPQPCFEPEDCGPGELCLPFEDDSFCSDVPALEICADAPEIGLLMLDPGIGGVISLAFVDADGDAPSDLVVGLDSGGAAVVPALDPIASPLPVSPTAQMLDAASGDFNGDMIPDLVVSLDDGSLSVLHGDGMGGFFEAQSLSGLGEFPEVAPLHFNSDGMLDLAVRNTGAAALVLLNLGDGTLAEGASLDTEGGIAYSISAGGNLVGDELDDVVVSRPLRDEVFEGDDITGTIQPVTTGELGPAFGERLIDVVDFNGDGLATFIGSTALPTWTLLEGFAAGLNRVEVPISAQRVGLGDGDGDGIPDVALLGGNRLIWVRGLPEEQRNTFSCWTEVLLEYEPIAASVGDWDANGLADLAITDGIEITIVLIL